MSEQVTSTPDNQAAQTADVSNKGDALTKLVEDYQKKYSGQTDGSTETNPPDTTAGSMTAADTGVDTRVQQDLAETKALLNALGIAGDVDVKAVNQRLKAGLLTKEDLLGLKPTVTQSQPKLNPLEKLSSLKGAIQEKINKGEAIPAEVLIQTLDGVAEAVRAVDNKTALSEREKVAQSCQLAALSVISQDDIHKSLPVEVQEIENKVFFNNVDCTIGSQIKNPNEMDVFVNPRSYDYFARQELGGDLKKLREAYIELGVRKAMESVSGRKPTINPISSTTGSMPASPPNVTINKDNFGDMVEAYKRSAGIV